MTRFKLLRNRKPLSSQEIAKQINFNNFILGYAPATSIFLSIKSWLIIFASSITAIVVTVMLLRSPSKQITGLTEPCVKPPIPQLTIHATNLLVSGNRDTVINYPSGTKLFIPAGAFVYSDNKLASGPFRIQFREFHDQVDQLLSGIPMVYDSAGVKNQFESAGMFDIRAYENDLPVFIKEGKELIVDMQSLNFDNDFNVYYLDTIQKNWIYDKENSENNILLTAGADTLLHRKFKSGFETIVLPEKADALFDNLVIDFDKEEFPELAFFDNVKFQFTDKKNKDYAGGSNKTWDDLKITRQSNKQYLVTFSKGKYKTSLVTIPVLEEKDFERALAEYDKIRVLRISKFKSITDSISDLVKRYDAQLIQNSLSSNQRLNDLIHNGNFQDAMNNYIDDETLNLMSKQKNGLSRMIFIRKFGISNFDRPFPLANAFSKAVRNTDSEKKHVLPKAHYYQEKDNVELVVENAYLIKRKFNGTYTLSKKNISEFPVLEAKGSDILIVITSKKEILFIKDKEFNATDYSGSEISFRMHAISQQAKSSEEIKKYLNL
jgi:hypothetical protein